MKVKIGLLVVVICFSLVGCAKEEKEVKTRAEEVGTTIESGDMEEINNLIFGINESDVVNGMEEILGTEESNTAQDGILSDIFKRNTIKVGNVSKDTIEYQIEAPNLSEIFVEILNEKKDLSEEQFLEYMGEYIGKAELKKVTVIIPYIVENEEIVIDYQNEEFIDAITGGLLSAYRQLYQDMINEYMKEMGISE